MNIHVGLDAIIFKEYSRNKYCLNKSNLQMSNIEYLRQLYHKKMNVQKDLNPHEGLLFLRKGPRFSVLRKGLDLHILRSRKEPELWTIYNIMVINYFIELYL